MESQLLPEIGYCGQISMQNTALSTSMPLRIGTMHTL